MPRLGTAIFVLKSTASCQRTKSSGCYPPCACLSATDSDASRQEEVYHIHRCYVKSGFQAGAIQLVDGSQVVGKGVTGRRSGSRLRDSRCGCGGWRGWRRRCRWCGCCSRNNLCRLRRGRCRLCWSGGSLRGRCSGGWRRSRLWRGSRCRYSSGGWWRCRCWCRSSLCFLLCRHRCWSWCWCCYCRAWSWRSLCGLRYRGVVL